MSTYGTMQDRIADELNRSDLTSQIQLAIKSAIEHYESDRFYFNEKVATTTTTASSQWVTQPTDMVELDTLAITNGSYKYTLNPRTYNYLEEIDNGNGTYTGAPEDYAVYQEQYRLYPVPDATYTLTQSYIYRLSDLSATADTNAWVTVGEQLIRYRAKADLMVNVLDDDAAKARLMAMAQMGKEFFTPEEEMAYRKLKRNTTQRISSGKIRGTYF